MQTLFESFSLGSRK